MQVDRYGRPLNFSGSGKHLILLIIAFTDDRVILGSCVVNVAVATTTVIAVVVDWWWLQMGA